MHPIDDVWVSERDRETGTKVIERRERGERQEWRV